MGLTEGFNNFSKTTMTSTYEMLNAGIGSSSGANLGQRVGIREDLHNPWNQIIHDTREVNDVTGINNKSGGNNNREGGGPSKDREQLIPPNFKTPFRRHTKEQLRKMEAFFVKFPRPDDEQRRHLAQKLNLEPEQVKFWFQNKRSQIKTQHEKYNNLFLRKECEKLKAENRILKEGSKALCPPCKVSIGPNTRGEWSFEKRQLILSNSQLKKQIRKLEEHATSKEKAPLLDLTGVSPPIIPPVPDLLHYPVLGKMYSPANKNHYKEMMSDLAISAMQEFVTMARMDDQLWSLDQETSSSLVLNRNEYSMVFSKETGANSMGFTSEASKYTTLVLMSSTDIVRILMDESQWSTVFSGIVASATTLEVLSAGGQETYHNALHLMKAEFQVLCPFVRTRESSFLRYCWNHSDDSWTVVDISVDDDWMSTNSSVRYRRKPSGCLIEDMDNGYSKVTWVEHIEVDDHDLYDLYKPFVNSGLAFGAKRWISILERHCKYLFNIIDPTLADIPNTIIPCMEGRRAMLKLAKRMAVSFHNGASSSTAQGKTLLLTGFENLRLMMRKGIDDRGHPSGTMLSATSSFCLPTTPHERVFGYLRGHQYRHEWDILSNGHGVEEIAIIPDNGEEWNNVSLLRIYAPGEDLNKMLILQENYSDPTGSFITYAPVNYDAINVVLEGAGDPDGMALLPSGFAIFPDGSVSPIGSRGCLVTITFQILISSNPNGHISNDLVTEVNNLMASAIGRIKDSIVS